ncbi:hypothetical protein BT67DRAFT_5661 [Trichocladium antarcticum]|uniref:Uncharacterized protein n=1 Tax=Trichocladium antarcticum TaxID=1450529 RepID=A0AAN6USV5_9PEZI|nr:hypothetical protein BT67DRAFT_5661 [Trichocladium antarcticum]
MIERPTSSSGLPGHPGRCPGEISGASLRMSAAQSPASILLSARQPARTNPHSIPRPRPLRRQGNWRPWRAGPLRLGFLGFASWTTTCPQVSRSHLNSASPRQLQRCGVAEQHLSHQPSQSAAQFSRNTTLATVGRIRFSCGTTRNIDPARQPLAWLSAVHSTPRAHPSPLSLFANTALPEPPGPPHWLSAALPYSRRRLATFACSRLFSRCPVARRPRHWPRGSNFRTHL